MAIQCGYGSKIIDPPNRMVSKKTHPGHPIVESTLSFPFNVDTPDLGSKPSEGAEHCLASRGRPGPSP